MSIATMTDTDEKLKQDLLVYRNNQINICKRVNELSTLIMDSHDISDDAKGIMAGLVKDIIEQLIETNEAVKKLTHDLVKGIQYEIKQML
jgi:adenylate kinase